MRKITKANVDYHIVSNGHQTDALADELPQQDQNVEGILRKWAYEPDAPNYTPRITGVLLGKFNSFFWIAKRNSEGVVPQHAMFVKPFVLKGLGFCVHTYMGDGDPLPSFQGEPYSVPLGEDAEDTANIFWENLDPDNRVALATKSINPRTGDMNYHIINQQRQSSQP
jgi:IMP cyclohydrolase